MNIQSNSPLLFNTGSPGAECIQYICSYTNTETKELIRDAKNLKSEAIMKIASSLYEEIINLTESEEKSGDGSIRTILKPILILHCPSTSFSLKKKKYDHMALILEKIKHIADIQAGQNNSKYSIDICTHAFLIDIDRRDSQHTKKRNERLTGSKDRFELLYRLDPRFIEQYKRIYIIDDVCTTGASLAAICNLLIHIYGANTEIRPLTYCH